MDDKGRQERSSQSWGEGLAAWIQRPLPWMVVLLVGLVARFRQYLGNPSYWYDEAFLTVGIYDLSFFQLIGPLPGRNIIPPFFLWLLRGCYLGLGPQEWSLRLPAFVAGVAALLLMVVLARRWLAGPGWLWAVGLCALSTHCINHAVEVRPYATDFLLTVAVLLAGHTYLRGPGARERFWGGGGLLLAAAVGPWLSFPSAFVLAAASGAVFSDYLCHRERRRLVFWLGLNGLLLLTSLLVWAIQARHLYYPGLKEEWTFVWGGFPVNYAPLTLAGWTLGALVSVAHYASTGLGIPLLLLGAAGLARCWRRSREEAILVGGPVLVTYLASVVGKYPFADRALFFLGPCVWLLAVEGLLALGRRLPVRAAPVLPLLVVGLMAPGLVKTVKLCARVEPKMEYREALAFVQEHRAQEDAIWSWCPDLVTVYFNHVFHWQQTPALSNIEDVPGAAQGGLSCPLWVIAPDNVMEEMVRPVRSLPVQQTLCRQFLGVKVVRFDAVR